MKKVLTTLVILGAFAVAGFAQPRAIGARLGMNEEFSYQHSITSNLYTDLTAGVSGLWSNYNGYNWGYADINAMFDWTFNIKGIWNWFVGPGAGVGFGFGSAYRYYGVVPFRVNIGGQIGFEWQFNIPLNLTIDWRPMINVLGFNNTYYRPYAGLYSFGVGLRYRFH